VQLGSARATFERLGALLDARRAAELAKTVRIGASSSRTVRTILFTDIVGSTSLIGVIGDDAWDDLRRWHDQALRADHGQVDRLPVDGQVGDDEKPVG
jgi:class 3 adenylate cyclase